MIARQILSDTGSVLSFLGIIQANRTSMCLDPQNKGEVGTVNFV